MATVTKLSISLPTPLVAELKRESRERGIPLSQLVAEQLEHDAKVTRFRKTLAEEFGPFTDEDRAAARALLASARTPDEILGER